MIGWTTRFRLRRVVHEQAAEVVDLGAEVAAVGETLQVDVVDAVGQQDAVELVEAAESSRRSRASTSQP